MEETTIELVTLIGAAKPFSPDGTATSFGFCGLPEEEFDDPKFGSIERESFLGEIRFGVVTSYASGFARAFGGRATKCGKFIHFRSFPDADTAKFCLALDEAWGNTCSYTCRVALPKGTKIAFGQVNGGNETQVYVHSAFLDKIHWLGSDPSENDGC